MSSESECSNPGAFNGRCDTVNPKTLTATWNPCASTRPDTEPDQTRLTEARLTMAAASLIRSAIGSARQGSLYGLRKVKRRERCAPKAPWRRRVEVLRDAGRQRRTFKPEKTGAGRA